MRLLNPWRAIRAFHALSRWHRSIVFYSEGRHDWPHLEPLVCHLAGSLARTVCYVGSEEDDPGLTLGEARVLAFCIGNGAARTVFFRTLEADVMVMTMPDLETFHIKRSVHSVRYVYVYHSLVSTHMIYRKGAFDHFDTIFCVGPHHVRELRESEALGGLPRRELVEHGCGRLDVLLERRRQAPPRPTDPDRSLGVLIAPSWGEQGLLETCGGQLVEVLLAAGFQVTVRPHPQLRRVNPDLLGRYRERFAGRARFVYEDDVATQDSFLESDLMVSDWSGAALEYAFGLERPVLFIDVPRKVNNPDYGRLTTEPIEVTLRQDLGLVLAPDRVAEAPEAARRLVAEGAGRTRHVAQLRNQYVFNVGTSGARGADAIVRLAAETAERRAS